MSRVDTTSVNRAATARRDDERRGPKGTTMDAYVFGRLAEFRRDDLARQRGARNLRTLFGK
jgi:hypothetical protein